MELDAWLVASRTIGIRESYINKATLVQEIALEQVHIMPFNDDVEVRREWGTCEDLRGEIQGGVKAEIGKKTELSTDNSSSIMMQRWMNESALDQPYNNIGAVPSEDAGLRSSGLETTQGDSSSPPVYRP
jgi:hypothetical protein